MANKERFVGQENILGWPLISFEEEQLNKLHFYQHFFADDLMGASDDRLHFPRTCVNSKGLEKYVVVFVDLKKAKFTSFITSFESSINRQH